MIFGFPFGCPFGDHDWIYTYSNWQIVDANSNTYAIQWIVNTGCDGYYRVSVDGTKIKDPIYCRAGILQQIITQISSGAHIITVSPQGQFSDNAVRVQDEIETCFEDGRHFPSHIQCIIRANVSATVDGTGSSQLTGISVSGLKRKLNVASVNGRPTWGVLDLALTTAGGVHTITGSVNGRVMVTGSRTGDGTITLTGAGARISMTLTYTGDFTSGVQLIARWPAYYPIYIKTSAFVNGDFPQDADARVKDDGFSNNFVFKSQTLTAGTKYVVVHSVGDDGLESTSIEGGGTPVTIYAIPDLATNLHYISGDGTNTLIGWTAPVSDTSVTYNYYDSGDTGIISLVTPTGTHAAGATPTQTLADIGTYTGARYVVVRSVKSGVEDPTLNMLTLNYAAGVIIPLVAPPAAGGQPITTSGRTITIPVGIYLDPNFAYPQNLELYVYKVGSSPDYNNPTATKAIPANPQNAPAINTTISGTVAANGVYYYQFGVRGSQTPLLNQSDDPVLNESGDPVYIDFGSMNRDGMIYGPVLLTDTAFGNPTFTAEGA